MENIERQFYIFLIALGIFVAGVQFGIHQGRTLQAEELGYKYVAPWEVSNADQ
jgi:hypothetical protein